MALNFATLMADFNGTAFAQAGTGEWGFIPEEWKLAIPGGFAVPANFTIGTSPFTNNASREIFLKANYHKLIGGGIQPATAFQVAVFRLHLADQGILTSDLNDRSVVEDEYAGTNPLGANWADALNNIPGNVYNANLIKHYKRYGNAYIHMMAYVFLSRGHHFKAEYNELYDRLKSAAFVPSNPGFPLLNNEETFRLAIHCFGVKPLVMLALADKTAGRMAAAVHIRYHPSTPISGTAHITTLSATLAQMRTEPWWNSFNAKFNADIATIDLEVVAIHTTPLAYHVSARVLGQPARLMPAAGSETSFKRLAQFALGYIDHLGRKHSLAGQQAVTKKSGGPTGLADAFSKACDRFGKPDVDVDDMTEFLKQV